jgi:hypothetical protein
MKDYQTKSWLKRFPERAAALADVKPLDTVVSFSDRMTLHLGGKTIEPIYVNDAYNPGDVAVWLPEEASCTPASSAISGGIPISAPITATAPPPACSNSLTS